MRKPGSEFTLAEKGAASLFSQETINFTRTPLLLPPRSLSPADAQRSRKGSPSPQHGGEGTNEWSSEGQRSRSGMRSSSPPGRVNCPALCSNSQTGPTSSGCAEVLSADLNQSHARRVSPERGGKDDGGRPQPRLFIRLRKKSKTPGRLCVKCQRGNELKLKQTPSQTASSPPLFSSPLLLLLCRCLSIQQKQPEAFPVGQSRSSAALFTIRPLFSILVFRLSLCSPRRQ